MSENESLKDLITKSEAIFESTRSDLRTIQRASERVLISIEKMIDRLRDTPIPRDLQLRIEWLRSEAERRAALLNLL